MSEKDMGDTILKVSSTEKRAEWKIPNFLSRPQKADDYFESPQFSFLDTTCCLGIYPRGKDKYFGSRFITAYLRKENRGAKTHDFYYRIGIRKRDGSEYRTVSVVDDESTSDDSDCEDNESKPDDCDCDCEDDEHESEDSESEDDQSSRKLTKLVKRSVLLNKSAELLPQGVLTVFCKLRTNERGNKEANNETVIPVDCKKLSDDFRDLFLTGNGSDVTLKVQDSEFKAHKAILRARSTVLEAMFTHDMKENNSGIVTISDCVSEDFKDLLLYMYSGKVEKISKKNMFGLYQAADKYNVIQLKENCVQFMMDSLSVETFCDVISLALRHNESELIAKAKMIFVKNAEKIIVTTQWFSFLKDHPVEANELYIKSLDERNSSYEELRQRFTLLSNRKNSS